MADELIVFLKANPTDFKRKLTQEHKYTVNQHHNYYMFYYGNKRKIISSESRGIILYNNPTTNDWEIVCRPFPNFTTERFTHDIDKNFEFDWRSARVFEKIDGSLVKLWYHDNE